MPTLTLVANEPVAEQIHLLTFDAALPGFDVPGQFVTAHLGDGKGFFALASVPGEPTELLVKDAGEVAHALCQLAPGATVEVSDPMGKGFGLGPAGDGTAPLVVLATGTGLSAVRGVVEAEVAAGLPRPVTLLLGVRTEAHLPLRDRLTAWREAGVDVHVVLSQAGPGWKGLRGYVQQAAKDLGVIRPDATVVLCGQSGLLDDARALWTEAGAAEDALHTNF